MVKLRRALLEFTNLATFLATVVIVSLFICFQHTRNSVVDHQSTVVGQGQNSRYIRDTRRSLMKFSPGSKKLEDALWTVAPSLKYKKLDNSSVEDKYALIAMEIKNRLMSKRVTARVPTTSETTPIATDAPTRPITTQSDTTPTFTDAPTTPITTESITTPIVTESIVKEITTGKG